MATTEYSKRQYLTDSFLQTFARSHVLKGSREVVWDTQLAAFGVRLTDSGVMSFIARARMPGAKNPTTITLGHYPAMTLKVARERAIDAVRELKAGKHPQAVKAEKREAEEARKAEVARKRTEEAKAKADTFEAVAEAWIVAKVPSFKRKGAYDTTRVIRKELVPVLGRKPVTQVTGDDVKKLIAAINKRSPSTARQALHWAKAIYEWAVEVPDYELSGKNPASGIKPKQLVTKTTPKGRALKDHEVRALWAAADHFNYPFIKILLLSGLRNTEAMRASWNEIDLKSAEWIVPGERMKDTKGYAPPHLVPLTKLMLAILKDVERGESGSFVWSTTDGKAARWLGDDIKVKVDAFMVEFIAKERGVAPVPELLPAWTWHDTRRTMRTIMSKLRVEYEIRELCLAHVKNGLDARYDFHDFAAEKRDALEQWGDWVARIARPLKVIKKLAKVA